MENWQYRKWYKPRVVIPVSSVLDSPLPPMTLVCLDAGELAILRSLLDYCHRRSSFSVTVVTGGYYVPDAETWDLISGVVSGLEGKLMTDCSDLITSIDSIATAVLSLGASVGDIVSEIEGAGAALDCICAKMPIMSDSAALGPIIDAKLEDGGLDVDDPYPVVIPEGEDADLCAISQLVPRFLYETLVEVIQPVQNKAISVLLPLALGVIAMWIGTPILAIPVGAILAMLWAGIDMWVEGELESVANAIYAIQDELKCAIYNVLVEGGDYASASSAAIDVIDEQEELSLLDKISLRSFVAPWVFAKCEQAWTSETSWAIANVSPGACEECIEYEGDTWFAVRVSIPYGDLEVDHPAGAYWKKGAVCGAIVSGETICGLVVECVTLTGACVFKPMLGDGTVCTGDDLLPNTSLEMAQGVTYYFYKPGTHDEDDAIAAMCAGATKWNQLTARTGPGTWRFATDLGWNCTGYAFARVKFVVYEK